MYDAVKRGLDAVLAAAGLAVLSPILLGIAVAVKLDSAGPVLYSGTRVGRNGRTFRMRKFRTMCADAERVGGSSTSADDPRLTRVGGVLRRYKLDELPQLLNVLTGEMSIVGPRPQVPWAVDRYSPEERLVLTVRPGITDYASLAFVNEGEILRGSSDPDLTYFEKIHPEKMRLSLEYVRDRSLLTDVRVVFRTFRALLRSRS